jgi:nucleotide-binding universal stress UspA family protein
VLVPLDGSPFAEQALPWAAAIARATPARLRLALVHQAPSPPPIDRATGGLYAKIELALRKSQDGYLATVAERMQKEHQVQVAKAILQGAPARALGEYVREVGVDLVVMTTHGVGGIRRAWLGSVADRLVRSLEIPMLLIRPREDAALSAKAPEVREILVALDGSRRAEAVLPAAAALAGILGAKLVLIQMVRPVDVLEQCAEIRFFVVGGQRYDDPRRHGNGQYSAPDKRRMLKFSFELCVPDGFP